MRHPLGDKAGLPSLDGLTRAGAIAHLIEYHGPLPASGELTSLHRNSHREGRIAVPHGHTGAGWEMPTLEQAAERHDKLTGLPADLPDDEMIAHLGRMHAATPVGGQRLDLAAFHRRVHRAGRLATPHQHGPGEQAEAARAGRVVTTSGTDLTEIARAAERLPGRPRLMAEEW